MQPPQWQVRVAVASATRRMARASPARLAPRGHDASIAMKIVSPRSSPYRLTSGSDAT